MRAPGLATLPLLIACCGSTETPPGARHLPPPELIGYWDLQRRGTNFMNQVESADRFAAAAAVNIRLVRLAPDKWRAHERDFLLGNADDSRGVDENDFAKLREVLDTANASGVRVVLTMLSLPGLRWVQNNGGAQDARLYTDPRFVDEACNFWIELADKLRGHPAIVGYNLLNEPDPERIPEARDVAIHSLYQRLVECVRRVDPDTPIVLDGPSYASPFATDRFQPVSDSRTLYAFHLYEPWPYVDHRQRGTIAYPGQIPSEDDPATTEYWDRNALARVLDRVVAWQQAHGVPSNRIFLGEFGCPRTHPGVQTWLGDVIALANERGWHWAFYAFREDTWAAMDYELGPSPLPASYWNLPEESQQRELAARRGDNAIWRALLQHFVSGSAQR